MSESPGVHLKGLNGIRAIAAIAVVVSHILQFGRRAGLPYSTGIDLAGFGVSIFFSLSGFLITYLLLTEKDRFGTINIKAFYMRRILRIWPLYFFYLLLAVAAIAIYYKGRLPGSLGYYIFMGAQIPFIFKTSLPLLVHYSSLGVEEQFYLFWPWIAKKSNNLVAVLIIFIAVFIAAKIGFRILLAQTGVVWPSTAIDYTRFECMAIGALGAVFFYKQLPIFLRLAFLQLVQAAAWGVIVLMATNQYHISSLFDDDITAGIAVVLIVNVAANPKTLVRLDYKAFDFLGKISFGIYVYHPLILFACFRLFAGFITQLNNAGKYIFLFSFVLIVTVITAWASYEFFEKWFLRKKQRYALVASSS